MADRWETDLKAEERRGGGVVVKRFMVPRVAHCSEGC